MRVGILTLGSRGDTQPFLALAQQLVAEGHKVAICCPCSTTDLVREHGFQAFGMTFDCKKAIQSEVLQEAMASGDGTRCVSAFQEAAKAQKIASGVNSALEASDFVRDFQPEIIVGHPSLQALPIVAEKYQLPVLVTMFMPLLPSRFSQPAFFTDAQLKEQGLQNTPLRAHKSVWDGFLESDFVEINDLRIQWGLHPYSSLSELHGMYQALPWASCVSHHVAPEPSDFAGEHPQARTTGYLFAEAPADFMPSTELKRFLTATVKDKPVYIGFGSLSAGEPRLVSEKVIRALILAGGKRCIMVGGWSGIGPEHLDPTLTNDYDELKNFADKNILKINAAPHSWLLPFCSAAVHHGGAGTVAAVARAGIPGAIAPMAWDQPWWAEHMEKLGVGIALPTMITALDTELLGSTIARLTDDAALAKHAEVLGAKVRSELSGSQRLVDFMKEAFRMHHPWPTSAQPVPKPAPPPLWERDQDRAQTTPVKEQSHGSDGTIPAKAGA